MLTQKAKYGLRAMCVLGGSQSSWLRASEIARQARIPIKFLESILVDLRHAGFVRSRRGQGGGHALAQSADHIVIGDLIRAIDGPLAPVRCASMTAYAPCRDCRDPEHCAVRELMKETRAALSSVLDQYSLRQLTERSNHEELMCSQASR